MAIFKVESFARFARKHSIPEVVLWMAAQDVLVGAFEADLGGGVYKKRVARVVAENPEASGPASRKKEQRASVFRLRLSQERTGRHRR